MYDDDYDLTHDDLESNLLAMSNSLQIQNLNIGDDDENALGNALGHCKNDDDEIDSNDDNQHSGSSSGDCFGSTGLFTAM